MTSRRRLANRSLTRNDFLFKWRSSPWRARGSVCAVDGLKRRPLGRNTVRKPRRLGIVGSTIGVEKLGLLLVETRAVAHR